MIKWIIGLLVVFVGLSGMLCGENSNLTKVGEWGTGSYEDVVVQANYAYCAAGDAGLDIIAVGNPANPQKIGNVDTPGNAKRIFVAGNYAYVADSRQGLQIIDISAPASPVPLGNYNRDNWRAEAVSVSGNYAYVASSYSGLDIIDISAPASPVLAGTYNFHHYFNLYLVHDVAVKDHYAYITLEKVVAEDKFIETVGELHILDISTPGSPVSVGMIGNLAYPRVVSVQGNFAYIGDSSLGLQILNISAPASPYPVGTFDTQGIYDIVIRDNAAYLAEYSDGLRVIDISAPSSPTQLGIFDTAGKALGVDVGKEFAYVADQENGLQLIDITNPSAPTAGGNYDTSGETRGLAVSGNYAYVADYRAGIQILDISNPAAPEWIGSYRIDSETQDVFVRGNYAYAADSEEGLFIIDVSNPSAPALVARYKGQGYPLSVQVRGDYAYVATSVGLEVINVANPASPTLSGNIETEGLAFDVFISGNYAYVADFDEGLQIIDISRPASPVRVGQYRDPSGLGLVKAVFVSGAYAYLASSISGVEIIDIANPASPVRVGNYPEEDYINDLYVLGNFAYVSDGNQLRVINISNPAVPVLAGTYTTSSWINANVLVSNSSKLVYMTGGSSGKLYIFDFDAAATPPQISLSRDELNFGSLVSGAVSPPQSFLVRNGGGGTLNWLLTVDQDWLDCSPTAGTSGVEVTATVNTVGLAAGTYSAIITVSDALGAISPQTVTVTLNIYQTGKTSEPFGYFATPLEGAVVRSSIPVTGWVLDDLGVVSVQIFREAGKSLAYIGDAVFVEGARPDVEQGYPLYPNNYQAGWGYMMLTNFLPGGGNGTFKLHAVATDLEGHQVTLGVKTIICDNANAVKPTGAIDTPFQGGTASGSNFINFGWTLTPLPNTIPTDGSTIRVWVDGVSLGHPVYNRYREDIAALFPGYNNSEGAGGYFVLDTTAYENGVHTIAWSVTDDAGNTDGVGSRYFSIGNPGTSGQASSSRAFGQKAPKTPGSSSLGTGKGVEGFTGLLENSLDNTGPLRVRKGYNPEKDLEILNPDETGRRVVEIEELERLEICLAEETGRLDPLSGSSGYSACHWVGFQVVGTRLRPLPIGSSLDSGRGIFYWQPGAAFLGNYRLLFLETDPYGNQTKNEIWIHIIPGEGNK